MAQIDNGMVTGKGKYVEKGAPPKVKPARPNQIDLPKKGKKNGINNPSAI